MEKLLPPIIKLSFEIRDWPNNERVSRKETLVQTQSNLLENKPIGYFSVKEEKFYPLS